MKTADDISGASACCDKTSECCEHQANTFRLDSEFESTDWNADFSQFAFFTQRPIKLTEVEFAVNSTQISHFGVPLPLTTKELLSNLQVYIL